MITYGLSMQDREHSVPEEVAVWLLEQSARYPLVDFKIDCTEVTDPESESVGKKYSRIWFGAPIGLPGHGVKNFSFLYLKEFWSIRIVGGSDSQGNISDMNKDGDSPLSAEQRAQISMMPSLDELEEVSESVYALPRRPDEIVEERPSKMVELPAEMYWQSGFSISAAELDDIFHGQPTERKAKILQALLTKDYETAKKWLNQRH